MKRYIKSNEPIMASSFNRVLQHMNDTECCFITAYRDVFNHTVNEKRNKLLEKKIKDAGFSFIRASDGYVEHDAEGNPVDVTEDTFCVINNRYTKDDFIKWAISLCKDVDPNKTLCAPNDPARDSGIQNQEAVLVTIPVPVDGPTRSKPRAVGIIGRYYDANGNIDMEFGDVTISDITEYFTWVCGKKFSLITSSEHINDFWRDVRGVAGRMLSQKEFRERYPDLL